MTHVVAPSVRL